MTNRNILRKKRRKCLFFLKMYYICELLIIEIFIKNNKL